MAELIALINGDVLEVHDVGKCSGPNCCIHNPSPHVLNDRPLIWRQDMRLMERMCEHGLGHPDPDDLAFKKSTMPRPLYNQYQFDVHSCDGCCRERRYA